MRELPRIGAELAGYRLESLFSPGGMAVVFLAEDMRLGPEGGAEDPRARAGRGRQLPRALPARVADGGEPRPPQRHPDLRRGRGRRRASTSPCAMSRTPTSEACSARTGALELERGVGIVTPGRGARSARRTRKDLVHRDVKPANVLLIQRASRRTRSTTSTSPTSGWPSTSSSVSGLTATGQFVGTVELHAPRSRLEGKAGRRAHRHLRARLRPVRGASPAGRRSRRRRTWPWSWRAHQGAGAARRS